MSIRAQIWGEDRAAIEARLEALDPELFRYIRDFAYEEVLARPGLPLATRELLAVTSLIALGNTAQLPTHLAGALNTGATVADLRETIIQAALFVGFPRALEAMTVLQTLLKKRAGG